MKLRHRLVMGTALLAAVAMVGSAPSAGATESAADDGRVMLAVSDPSLAAAGGKLTATVSARPGVTSAKDKATVTGTCYLGGELPSLQPSNEFMSRLVYFGASLRCDVSGRVELTVAIQQATPGGGGYVTEAIRGPYSSPSPGIVGLGVFTTSKPCFQISQTPWRGLARPRLITATVIYDWGWIPTYDTPLSC